MISSKFDMKYPRTSSPLAVAGVAVFIVTLLFATLPSCWAQAPFQVWKFQTGEAIVSSPVVGADGTIYVASYDRTNYALTPGGSNQWTFALPEPTYIWFGTYTAVYGTPAIGPDGTVYVPAENGRLHALNPTNGTPKWSYPTAYKENAIYTSPAVGSDGTIYFAFYDTDLIALYPNGTRKWASRFRSTIFASPAIGPDGTVYCGCDDGKLYAVNPTNGTQKWAFNTGSYAITASPAISSNGTIYIGVGSQYNPKFYAIHPDGTTNWIFTTGNRIRSSAALGPDGAVYFGCDDQRLYALNPDGTKRWDFLAGGTIGSSPAVLADGTVVFGCDDGELYAVNSIGTKVWGYRTSGSIAGSPIMGRDGTLYFAGGDWALYALRECQTAARSCWPMFRGNPERTACLPANATNQSPVLAAIPDQTVALGRSLVFTNFASDPDGPIAGLSYSLAAGAPVGAAIDPASGVFTWTPTTAQAPSTNWITVAVCDNGVPRLSDVRCFTAVVVSQPVIQSTSLSNGVVNILWSAVPGKTYRLQYRPSLPGAQWIDLPGEVTADGVTASKNDSPDSAVKQRFYQVEELP